MAEILLVGGEHAAKVDQSDFERLSQWTWYAHKSDKAVYARGRITKDGWHRLIFMHRLLLDCPEDMCIDHINRDTLDNRRCNLRIATRTQNGWNKPGVVATSRFKGVSWNKKDSLWRAQISYHGKRWYLGESKCEEDCAVMYNVAAQLLHGQFAFLNDV